MKVLQLIIKENMRLQYIKHALLLNSTHKKSLDRSQAPGV